MPSSTLIINDTDAEVSGVLGRMRLDGLDRATVPFDERFVHAWRRGTPQSDMDISTLMSVLEVRGIVR